jgi:hypothetical protein
MQFHNESASKPAGKEQSPEENPVFTAAHENQAAKAVISEVREPEKIENELEVLANDKTNLEDTNKFKSDGVMHNDSLQNEYNQNESTQSKTFQDQAELQAKTDTQPMSVEQIPNQLPSSKDALQAHTIVEHSNGHHEGQQEKSKNSEIGHSIPDEGEKQKEIVASKQAKITEEKVNSATEEPNLVIPDLFPLGLEVKGFGKLCHPVEIDASSYTDSPESMLLFYRWLQELENPNINGEHVFGRPS